MREGIGVGYPSSNVKGDEENLVMKVRVVDTDMMGREGDNPTSDVVDLGVEGVGEDTEAL